MSMKSLKKAVTKSPEDTFEDGTVIRWLGSGKYNYAAMKANGRWYTTAQTGNGYCPQVMTFETLLRIIERAETTGVMVSDSWIEVQ